MNVSGIAGCEISKLILSMIRVTSRPYSEQELDDYSEIMGWTPTSMVSGFIISSAIGAVLTLGTFGVLWVWTWFASGKATWTVPLIVGGVGAVLIFVAMRVAARGQDWTTCPPELATDVVGTADAAWWIDDDSPNSRLMLRLDPDAYLIVNQSVWLPSFGGEEVESEIGTEISAVLLGEEQFRRVIESKVSGPKIPITTAEVYGWADDDAEPDTYRPTPDGVYTFAQLPASLRDVVNGIVRWNLANEPQAGADDGGAA